MEAIAMSIYTYHHSRYGPSNKDNEPRSKSAVQSRVRGFTLIELVVAIAILAIIVAIALPSYTSQVLRSNRTEAIDELLRQAAFQQASYTRTNAFAAVGNYQTPNQLYRIRTFIQDAGQSFRVRAIPINAQTEDTCGWLQINHLGQKRSAGDNASCWSGRNN